VCQVRGHSCAQASVCSVVSTALPGKSVAAGIHEESKKEAVGNHKRGQGVCVYYCSTYYTAQYAHPSRTLCTISLSPTLPHTPSFFRARADGQKI
jgi:hypothetical protein